MYMMEDKTAINLNTIEYVEDQVVDDGKLDDGKLEYGEFDDGKCDDGKSGDEDGEVGDDDDEPLLRRNNAIRRKGWKKVNAKQRMLANVLDHDFLSAGDDNEYAALIRCKSCCEKLTGSSLDLTPTLLSMYDQYPLKDHIANRDVNSDTKQSDANDNLEIDTKNLMVGQENTNPSNENCDKMSSTEVGNKMHDETDEIDETGETADQTDMQIHSTLLTDNKKRPLSISSMSSASSSSLPNNFHPKRQNLGDFDTLSSGPDAESRSSFGMATDGSSSNVSVDTTSLEGNEENHTNNDYMPIYDNVYEEMSSHNSDANIYENVSADIEDLTDTNDEEVYSNYNDYCSNERFYSRSNSADSEKPVYVSSRKLTLKSCSDKPRSSRNRLFKSPLTSPKNAAASQDQHLSYAERVSLELVETEQTYMKSLQEIILGYMHDLNHADGVTVSEEDKNHLFGNLVDIYKFSRILLKQLVDCGNDPVQVAQCFVNHSQGFTIYASYCTNYPKSMAILTKFMSDSKIAEVFRLTQACLGHGLALGAYLLKPVQRILKYHLLFQNIVKNYDSGSQGYETLQQALETMTSLAKDINEMKRKHEHAVRIQEVGSQLDDYIGPDLTTLGELLLEDTFRMYGAKASRQAFLFERAILVTKKKDMAMMSCKAFIMCQNLMLVESVPKEPQSFHIIPFNNPKLQCTLVAQNIDIKRRWCQEIKKLILASYSDRIPEKAKSLVMELGLDNESVGVSDFVDNSSGYKQHVAPGYLEKRIKGRRKSGTFIDFTLLRNRKGVNKKGGDGDWKQQISHPSTVPKLTNFNNENMEEFMAMVGSKSMDDISRLRVNHAPSNTKHHSLDNGTPNKSPASIKTKPFSFRFSRLGSSDGKVPVKESSCDEEVRNADGFHGASRRDSGKASSDTEIYETESESEGDGSYVNVLYGRKAGRRSESEAPITDVMDDDTDRDSGYVTMVMLPSADTYNGHRPLQRMNYSKSLTSLTKMTKDQVNTMISKHSPSAEVLTTKAKSPSPITSNSSSYENLSFKWQHSCANKPAVLPKPVNWKTMHNAALSNCQQQHSQPTRQIDKRPTSWSSNELTIYEEQASGDPWVRNSRVNEEPMHPALRKLSRYHSYENHFLPANRSASVPNSHEKSNFDWIVYKSKLAHCKSHSFDKLQSGKSVSSVSEHSQSHENTSPNPAPCGTPVTTPNVNILSPNSPTSPTNKSSKLLSVNSHDPVICSASVIPTFGQEIKSEATDMSNADQIIEEMENYARISQNSSYSHLPKFPTSPYTSYKKSKNGHSNNLKEQQSLASSRESLKSLESTGSASTILSSFSGDSNLTLSGRCNSDSQMGDVKNKLYAHPAKSSCKMLSNRLESDNYNSCRYGRVNLLARKYNCRDRQFDVKSLYDTRSRSGSCLETTNTEFGGEYLPQKCRAESLPGSLNERPSSADGNGDALSTRLRNSLENSSLPWNTKESGQIYKINSTLSTPDDKSYQEQDFYCSLETSFETDYVCNEIDYLQQEYVRPESDLSLDGTYEKRMMASLDGGYDKQDIDDEVFSNHDLENEVANPHHSPPEIRPKPRVSIKKFVRIIEENSRPKPTCTVDAAKKRMPSGAIQERLRHLEQNSQYQQQQRTVDLVNGESPPKSLRLRKAELFRNSPDRLTSHGVLDSPTDTNIKSAHSLGNLDEISGTKTLETMRGWVQQLISKFQSEK